MTEVDFEREKALSVAQLVDALVVGLMNARIHPAVHSRVVGALQEVRQALARCAAVTKETQVTLGVIQGCIVHEGRPLIGASLSAKRLIECVSDRGAGAIQLAATATDQDLRALMSVLVGRPGERETFDVANRRLGADGASLVRFLPPFTHTGGRNAAGLEPNGTTGVVKPMLATPISLYQSTVQLLQGMTISVCRGNALNFEASQGIIERILAQLQSDAKLLLGMSRSEQYDAYTFGHSIRVCLLAVNFARHLAIGEKLINRIGVAALLHDIGKSKIPFEVLHCKARLDAEQKRIMEQHAILGAQVLLEAGCADPMCIACAFGHHLTQGHGGYPRLHHHADLSLATHIVKICDVYEALTAVHRPYKDPMSPVRAFRIMTSMRQHFDEALLRRFIEVNGIYPVGARVGLTNGAEALVEKQTALLHLPQVKIIRSPHGEPFDGEDQELVDLAASIAAGGILRIHSILDEAGVVGTEVPAAAGSASR